MRIYKDLKLVEQLGSGVPRILESYDRSCFTFSDNFLRMSFPKAVKDTIGGTKGGIIGGTKDGIINALPDRQREVLELIQADLKISITKIADALEINRSAAQDHVDALMDKGIIDREGTRGYWKIITEN